MTTRKLTPDEIDKLFELCEFHNVRYFDVQIELVDHFASSIEALWETNSELPFEEATSLVGEQFNIEPWIYSTSNSILPSIFGKKFSGENGFEIIMEAKERELRRKYDRLQLKYIAEFFKLPKIILTLIITFILYYLLKYTGNKSEMVYILQCIYILSLAVYIIFIYPKKNRISLVDDKSFLLYEHFKKVKKGAVSITIAWYNLMPLFFKISHLKFCRPYSEYINTSLFAAFLMTLFSITTFAICMYLPQRIKADFIREYPQFVKA